MRFLVAAAALPALAQVARIDLGGIPNPLVIGRSANLLAVTRAADGRIVAGPPISITSSDPNVIRMNSPNAIEALRVGTARITAVSGDVRTHVDIATAPARIEVIPASAAAVYGDQIPYNARVLDAQGREVPDPPRVAWAVIGPNGARTGGPAFCCSYPPLLDARSVGRFTVEASLAGVKAFGAVTIRPRPAFRLSRVFSNDRIPGPQRFVSPASNVVFGESGHIAFLAHLNGWAQQFLMWENGRFTARFGGGDTDWGVGTINHGVAEGLQLYPGFTVSGVTSRGEALLGAARGPGPGGLINGLAVSARNAVTNLLPSDVRVGRLWNRVYLGPRGINDSGDVAFAGEIQFVDARQSVQALFKLRDNQLAVLVTPDQVQVGGFLPDVGRPEYPLIDGLGRVYFKTGSTWRRADASQRPETIVALSGLEDGSRIIRLSQLVVNESGAVAYVRQLNDRRNQLIRERPGGVAETHDLQPEATYEAFAVDAAGRVLLRVTQAAGPPDLAVWQEGAERVVIAGGVPAPDGGEISSIVNAGFGADGEAVAHITTSRGGAALLKAGGVVLLKTGDLLDVPATPFFDTDSLVRGAGLRLRLGSPGSLVEVRAGRIEPVVTIGDRLPDGGVFAGSELYQEIGGGVYFISGNRLLRRTPAGYEEMTALGPNQFSVNRRGQIALIAERRLYRVEQGRETLLADLSTAEFPGGAYGSWELLPRQIAIDERGRIMAAARSGRAVALLLYDGAWRTVARTGETRIGGIDIYGVSDIRVAGDRFYAGFNFSADSVVASYQDGAWRLEAGPNDLVPGSSAGFIIRAFDVNSRGDVLIHEHHSVLMKSGGVVKLVYGDWDAVDGSYVNIRNIMLQDDGIAYFTGFDPRGRYLVVRADPL